jgi:5-methylcytosine-specific restriction endonuclease McrA
MKAEVISARQDRVIRSINQSYVFPSVIRLSCFVRIPYKKVELSRKNILRRDNYQCQYCGTKNGIITIDHIVPKSRGGLDSWDNLVTACIKCNNKKANKTPEESEMKLLRKPRKPNHIFFLRQLMDTVQDNWKPFLFY